MIERTTYLGVVDIVLDTMQSLWSTQDIAHKYVAYTCVQHFQKTCVLGED